MLKRISVHGYKSLRDTEIAFSQVTLLLGPLGAGKSNILRSIKALSAMAKRGTVAEALALSNEGELLDAFSLPVEGEREKGSRSVCFEADLLVEQRDRTRYRIAAEMDPTSRAVVVCDEYLTSLTKGWHPKGVARIERKEGQLKIRRRAVHSAPYVEDLGLHHALLCDPRLSGASYPELEQCREHLSDWRFYRLAGLAPKAGAIHYQEVSDIGTSGDP